eukprot:GILJ01011037.1.p1 GENE.GILJ01011037.1~~GILJ01011037.1.p1  ORF type:complete len:237 (+),score=26.44 GILJ01011037.1:108-818(+)
MSAPRWLNNVVSSIKTAFITGNAPISPFVVWSTVLLIPGIVMTSVGGSSKSCSSGCSFQPCLTTYNIYECSCGSYCTNRHLTAVPVLTAGIVILVFGIVISGVTAYFVVRQWLNKQPPKSAVQMKVVDNGVPIMFTPPVSHPPVPIMNPSPTIAPPAVPSFAPTAPVQGDATGVQQVPVFQNSPTAYIQQVIVEVNGVPTLLNVMVPSTAQLPPWTGGSPGPSVPQAQENLNPVST